jgi:metal-sulfur cluster biosynthetic enzyme
MIRTEECWDQLRTVIDPEIFENIVDLGLVYEVIVQPEDVVDVNMTLTTPHCPMGPQIIANVEGVLTEIGARHVNVNIVWEPMWTPDAMTDDLKRKLGILEDEEPEPEPVYELPPPPPAPKKKGFFNRLFGG